MNLSVDLQDRCNSVNWTETDRDREWEWGDLRLLVYCSKCVYGSTSTTVPPPVIGKFFKC